MAIEMGFDLEYVKLGDDFGDSGRPVDGLCFYHWLKQHHRDSISCARARAMTVFAGVLAECAISGQGNAWEMFAQQKDDIDKLGEILNTRGRLNQVEADRWQLDVWNKCSRTISRKKRQIRRVADALCEKGCLSGSEVRTLLLAESPWLQSKSTLVLALAVLLVTCAAIVAFRRDPK